MRDKIVYDIVKILPQRLAARHDELHGLSDVAQAVGFNDVLGFHIADAFGDRSFSFSKTISSFG